MKSSLDTALQYLQPDEPIRRPPGSFVRYLLSLQRAKATVLSNYYKTTQSRTQTAFIIIAIQWAFDSYLKDEKQFMTGTKQRCCFKRPFYGFQIKKKTKKNFKTPFRRGQQRLWKDTTFPRRNQSRVMNLSLRDIPTVSYPPGKLFTLFSSHTDKNVCWIYMI